MAVSTVVRDARPEDAEAIAWLQVRGWQQAFADILDAGYLASLTPAPRADYWRTQIQRGDPGASIRVAGHDAGPVGFCACGPSRDDDARPTTGEVYLVYIDLDLLGTGVGGALMTDGLDFLAAQGHVDVTLWTLEANSIGRAFYERTGWELDGAAIVRTIGPDELTEVRYRRTLCARRNVIKVEAPGPRS